MPTAQEIIDGLKTPEMEDDVDFSEVEHRITLSQYYRLILTDSLFNNDTSPAAQQVETEIRDFVKERVKILLGIAAPKIQVVERDPIFTADEILALKELAHKLLEAGPLEKQSENVAPVAKPEPTPVVETKKPLKPKPTKPALKKPMLRKAEVPNELRNATGMLPNGGSAIPLRAPGPQAGDVGVPGHIELDPNPKTGAARIKKNGKVLERAINPNDGSIALNEKNEEIWLDITPVAKPPPGTGFVPMPMGPDAMANIGMQDVMRVQTELAKGPLAGIADLFINKG